MSTPDDSFERSIDGAERELESALRSLAPAGNVVIDPIAAAFDAGRRAVGRQVLVWRGSALSATAALAASLLWFVTLAPQRPLMNRDERVARTVSISIEASDQSALRLRNAVLDHGWDALPRAAGGGSSDRVISARDML
jgi:hypothetical protein